MARTLALLLCLTAVTVFAKGKNADQRKFVRDKLFKNLKDCILIDPVNLLTADCRIQISFICGQTHGSGTENKLIEI